CDAGAGTDGRGTWSARTKSALSRILRIRPDRPSPRILCGRADPFGRPPNCDWVLDRADGLGDAGGFARLDRTGRSRRGVRQCRAEPLDPSAAARFRTAGRRARHPRSSPAMQWREPAAGEGGAMTQAGRSALQRHLLTRYTDFKKRLTRYLG